MVIVVSLFLDVLENLTAVGAPVKVFRTARSQGKPEQLVRSSRISSAANVANWVDAAEYHRTLLGALLCEDYGFHVFPRVLTFKTLEKLEPFGTSGDLIVCRETPLLAITGKLVLGFVGQKFDLGVLDIGGSTL